MKWFDDAKGFGCIQPQSVRMSSCTIRPSTLLFQIAKRRPGSGVRPVQTQAVGKPGTSEKSNPTGF